MNDRLLYRPEMLRPEQLSVSRGWRYLVGAIVVEIAATTVLPATDGFTNALPTIVVLAGYGASFYLLSKAIVTIALGTAYALWGGVGTAAVAVLGAVVYGEALTAPKVLGLLAVVVGVVVLNMQLVENPDTTALEENPRTAESGCG